MPFKRFAQVGRVIYIRDGKHKGKLAAIVDIIDTNRALIDGPFHGIQRQEYPLCETQLLPWTLKIVRSQKTKMVRRAWEKQKINNKYEKCSMNQNIIKRQIKLNMGDFDRYKLGRAKQTKNKIVKKAAKTFKREASTALSKRSITVLTRVLKKRAERRKKILEYREKRKANPKVRPFKVRRSAKGRKKSVKEAAEKAKEAKEVRVPKTLKTFKKVKALLAKERAERLAAPKGSKDPAEKRTEADKVLVMKYKKYLSTLPKEPLGYRIPKEKGRAKLMRKFRLLKAYKRLLTVKKAKQRKIKERKAKREARRKANREKYGKSGAEKKTADGKPATTATQAAKPKASKPAKASKKTKVSKKTKTSKAKALKAKAPEAKAPQAKAPKAAKAPKKEAK